MSQVRNQIVADAYEDWLLSMAAGLSPRVARELMEYEYPYFTEKEELLLSDAMLTELEKRMEVKR